MAQSNSLISASVGIQWRGFDCAFTDWHFFPAIDLCRDYLPTELKKQLEDKHCGDLIQHTFAAGELLDEPSERLCIKVPIGCFQTQNYDTRSEPPRIGRFYPSDSFHKVDGIYQSNERPCRITEITDDYLKVDFNHPLAGKKIGVKFRIHDIRESSKERDASCKDIVAESCHRGPGMQDRLETADTDFFSSLSFSRLDDNDDAVYFRQPSFTPYWDQLALQQVSDFYEQHIDPQSHVLDLMAGAHSPLQEIGIQCASITSAGLNRQELEHNKISTRIEVLDVNRISRLPFKCAEFDVVLIHAAIEYVIQPGLLIHEISRVLKPAGKFIISFSNRNESQKAIHLWSNVYEFERPGIVLAYLRNEGGFCHYKSCSQRGYYRPEDDRLSPELLYSDPVYIVMAEKSGVQKN